MAKSPPRKTAEPAREDAAVDPTPQPSARPRSRYRRSEPRVALYTRVIAEVADELEDHCAAFGQTKQEAVEALLTEGLRRARPHRPV